MAWTCASPPAQPTADTSPNSTDTDGIDTDADVNSPVPCEFRNAVQPVNIQPVARSVRVSFRINGRVTMTRRVNNSKHRWNLRKDAANITDPTCSLNGAAVSNMDAGADVAPTQLMPMQPIEH